MYVVLKEVGPSYNPKSDTKCIEIVSSFNDVRVFCCITDRVHKRIPPVLLKGSIKFGCTKKCVTLNLLQMYKYIDKSYNEIHLTVTNSDDPRCFILFTVLKELFTNYDKFFERDLKNIGVLNKLTDMLKQFKYK